MATPRFRHYFLELMPVRGEDASNLTKLIEKEEAGGNEYVSLTIAPKTENFLVCFRWLEGDHEPSGM